MAEIVSCRDRPLNLGQLGEDFSVERHPGQGAAGDLKFPDLSASTFNLGDHVIRIGVAPSMRARAARVLFNVSSS